MDTDFKTMPGNLNAAKQKEFKVLRKDHAKFYATIRSSLSDGDIIATADSKFNVPQLLRYLRAQYENDGSVFDRNGLRIEFQAISVEQYDTVLQYKQDFDRLLGQMRTYGIDLVNDEEAASCASTRAWARAGRRMCGPPTLKAWTTPRPGPTTESGQDETRPFGSLVMAVPKASSSSILSSKKGVVHNVSAAMGVAEVVEIVTQVLAKAGGSGGVVHNINHTRKRLNNKYQK